MDSAFVYGSLAIVMAAQARRGRRATVATSVAMLLIFAIGASRIILGVHWPTDVLGGWTLGAAWAMTARLLLDAWQGRKPEEAS